MSRSTTGLFLIGLLVCISTAPSNVAHSELPDAQVSGDGGVGRMHFARSGHQATLLLDGSVLATGGSDGQGNAIATAEIFDPATRTWTEAAANHDARVGHAASLLYDGRVLVVGGTPSTGACEPMSSAELYDPTTDRWSRTSQLPVPVDRGAVAVTLADGRVLVAGGRTNCESVSSSAALFDPTNNTWSRTASMEPPAEFLNATLLGDGRVVVSGAATTIYDPETATWAPLGDPRPLTGAACQGDVGTYSRVLDRDSVMARATSEDCSSVTVLPAGTLLVAGGLSRSKRALGSVQIMDLKTGEGVRSWDMRVARVGHTATRLENGVVLIAGGRDGPRRIGSSELYIPRLAYHAWTSAIPRVHGPFASAATNSRDSLLISYAGSGEHVSQLVEWSPPAWADFTGRTEPSAGVVRFGPKPPGDPRHYLRFARALRDDLPALNSLRIDEQDNIWGVSAAQEIIKISPDGQVLLRFGKSSSTESGDPSRGSRAQDWRQYVENATDLAIDRRGNVFVTDAGGRPRIVKFDGRGRFIVATGGRGSAPGKLDFPHSVATDAEGNVYVADSGNARIQVFDNGLNHRAVYDMIGTPWAICVTKGSRQFLYSTSNADETARSRRAAEIYKLELNGTVLGKTIANEPGKVTFTPDHMDCPDANIALTVGYPDHLRRITFGG
jgi:hypothetical protein